MHEPQTTTPQIDAGPGKTAKLNLGRTLRIALSVLLFAVFAFALLPGILYSQFPVGRVNAELITVRAPIGGQIVFDDVPVGAMVKHDQPLAVIRDQPDHDVRLADFQSLASNLTERITVLNQQIAALTPFLQRLNNDSQNFHHAVLGNLSAQIAETQSRIIGAEANTRLLDSQLKRIQPLAGANYASRAELDRRRAEAEIGQADLTTQRETLKRLKLERDAAGLGIYLSDSFNNAPYSQQRRDDIELQRLTLQTRSADLQAEQLQVQQQLRTEQRRRLIVGEAIITASVDGIFWRRLESDGATIISSAPLMQLADCKRLFFEVVRDRKSDETLSIGSPTEVEFEQSDRMTTYPARLVGLRGEQDTGHREFAIDIPVSADQLRWIFSVTFPNNHDGTACPIGQIGRLRHSDTSVERIVRRTTALFRK